MRRVLPLVLAALACAEAAASFPDFTGWTLVEDPPNGLLTASATASSATLSALGGPVPVATDIGYQSVNANTPAASASGYFFDPAADFSLAIDYDLGFTDAVGGLGIGFGIGEDGDGRNSAGMALATLNGSPLAFTGAARVNNSNQPFQVLTTLGPTLTGSLFVAYEAASGNIVLGAATTQGADAPDAAAAFDGLQDQWAGDDLLVSFFLRSDAVPVFAPNGWVSGAATAVFSNLRLIGDSDGDSDVDVGDALQTQRAAESLSDWRTYFGARAAEVSAQPVSATAGQGNAAAAVPEPTSGVLLLASVAWILNQRPRE